MGEGRCWGYQKSAGRRRVLNQNEREEKRERWNLGWVLFDIATDAFTVRLDLS